MPRIIISTSNHITTDNRVHKVAMVLQELGYEVLWLGRNFPKNVALSRPYATKRFNLWFTKGVLFYANLNIRLFFYLLFARADVLLSNDLDTLLPNFLVSRLRGRVLVYDTHEYFLGVPEIQQKPFVKWVWRSIEAYVFPKLKHVFTVNESISALYEQDYSKRPMVFRNISLPPEIESNASRKDLALPEDRFIFINQGSGINIDRGMEEALKAIAELDGALLLLVGNGDVIPKLKQRVADKNLTEKVRFVDSVPYHQLLAYTKVSDVGLSLDKPTNINYKYSLPNKVFDYIYCQIPILASNVVEVATLVNQYKIGIVIENHQKNTLKTAMKQMMVTSKNEYASGLKAAKAVENWHHEKQILVDFYNELKQNL